MRRLLQSAGDRSAAEQPLPESVDSDVFVVLASLLCALICVVGLVLVARWAWFRRYPSSTPGSSASATSLDPPRAGADKGIKKKALDLIPTVAYNGAAVGEQSDCAICLAEFSEGDIIRVLPQCGHGFHIRCVDAWLGSNSSCPSCRTVLTVGGCQKDGGVQGVEGEAMPSRRTEDENGGGYDDRYLP